jgi:hypothetical protein
VSCKYTAGGIVLVAFIRQFPLRDLKNAVQIRCLFLCTIVVFLHLVCYSVHLQMLPFIPDSGAAIPHSIRDSLISRIDPDWEARHRAASIDHRILDLVLSLPQGGNRSRVNQTFASRWHQLPLFTGPSVPYWMKDGRHILCMGNVLLWWPVFFGVVANVLRVLATQAQ